MSAEQKPTFESLLQSAYAPVGAARPPARPAPKRSMQSVVDEYYDSVSENGERVHTPRGGGR